MRVRRILDLQPRGTAAVALIRPPRPLRYDALEIALAGELVQAYPARRNCIEEHQAGFNARHDARKPTLALIEGQRAQILAIDRQHIEREEVRPLTAEHQIVKAAATVRAEADDSIRSFAVGSCRPSMCDHRGFPLFHRAQDFVLRTAHRRALKIAIDLQAQFPPELVRHKAADTVQCPVTADFLDAEQMAQFFGLPVLRVATKYF